MERKTCVSGGYCDLSNNRIINETGGEFKVNLLYTPMHFCSVCDNMYYIRLNEENPNKIVYYCRNCGNENDTLPTENICVSKIEIKQGGQRFDHIINKYTKYDPTLPRTNTVLCINSNCVNAKDAEGDSQGREIIYLRYDAINMKYVYLCPQCDSVWEMTSH
jgi:DNA-directed RNA polymerase subunit M/transcription elongation factor TFIIS